MLKDFFFLVSCLTFLFPLLFYFIFVLFFYPQTFPKHCLFQSVTMGKSITRCRLKEKKKEKNISEKMYVNTKKISVLKQKSKEKKISKTK